MALEGESDPLWQNLDWAIGQMLLMGWDGTAVTPQIRSLIEEHHLGSIILTAKNLKSADETAKLVQELQIIAHQAGHPVPLLIALDQENGGVNSLFDEDYICQFPSAMGASATASLDMARKIANATAKEIKAVGVNLILGPVLDVLSNARLQPIGVRSSGDNPEEVSEYSIAAISGYKDAGLATCGKHFPTYGALDFQGSSLDIPIITQTFGELRLNALIPYQRTIATGKLDAVFVGGCGIANSDMKASHACLSDSVVDGLLRQDLEFDGVVISECLEMEALYQEIGVENGTVRAVQAGCDLVLLCKDFNIQREGIRGLTKGMENACISRDRVMTSLRRVLRLKSTCTSWEEALNPPGTSLLSQMHHDHLELSKEAYENSITVMRDDERILPLSRSMEQHEELLLLTPLIKPLPASSATKAIQSKSHKLGNPTIHNKWAHHDRSAIMTGEGVFRELGRSITRARNGKVLHTSYTANGVRPVHENLIHRASVIIIITADANRNLYQSGFTKHVAMMCSLLSAAGRKKSLVVVAVSSPYDFALDKTIGTYICTFDFTETAMQALVRALFGEFAPKGTLPGTLRKSKRLVKSRQQWLVESYKSERHATGLNNLLRAVDKARAPNSDFLSTTSASSFELPSHSEIEQAHFVVRNSSTEAIYGFCATYYLNGVGSISALLVHPAKRNLAIGHALHRRALRGLVQKPGIETVQLGASFPSIFLGIPADDSTFLKTWFANNGWDTQYSRRLATLVLPDTSRWIWPEGLRERIGTAGVNFDLTFGLHSVDTILDHINTHAPHAGGAVLALYRFALHDEAKACGVVRAKDATSGHVLGTIIISSPESALSRRVPCLKSADAAELVGGIVAPIIEPGPRAAIVLQGLVLMGVRQNKAHGAARSVLSWATQEMSDPLVAMGFQVLQAFEEITNSADNWDDFS